MTNTAHAEALEVPQLPKFELHLANEDMKDEDSEKNQPEPVEDSTAESWQPPHPWSTFAREVYRPIHPQVYKFAPKGPSDVYSNYQLFSTDSISSVRYPAVLGGKRGDQEIGGIWH